MCNLRNCGNLLVLAIVCGLPAVAAAQRPIARYQPARPTISPYLNLFRRDFGPVPNYYTQVRPELRQRAATRQLQREVQSQRQRLDLVSPQLQLGTRFGPAAVAPTGGPAGFMTHLKFFQTYGR